MTWFIQVSTFLYRRWRRSVRPAIAMLTTMALVACTLGLPLPLQLEKPSEEPYPCQNCACGCANAEMCWKNCCCYTQEQKLAWAEKHGVTPPDYVLAFVAATRRPCCESKKQATKSTSAKKCCCHSVASCCEKSPEAKSQQDSKLTSVVTLLALKCHGLTSLITSLPPMVIRVDCQNLDLLAIQDGTVLIDNTLYNSPADGPDSPPPQPLA